MLKHYEKPSLPSNYTAETELLGMLLMNNQVLALVQDFLQADHFFEPVNGRIYKAILDMFLGGETANPITLKNRFDADEALADIGGWQYLVKLATGCSSFGNAGDYGRVIFRCWQKRQIIDWCSEALQEAGDTENDALPDEIAVKLTSRINDMSSSDKRRIALSDTQVMERIVAKMRLGGECYSTGLAKLDTAMRGGLYPGKLYGFAAFSKVGKTNLAATISYNLACNGVKHSFICGEMGADEIHERVAARAMRAFPSEFTNAEEPFIKTVEAAISQFNGFAVYQNAPGLTFDDLKQYVSRAIYKDKAKGIILDYFQLVGGAKPRESEAKHLDGVAQWLADFGREHNIFTIVTAQRNDEGDVRGSRGLRLACDQLYYLHRDDLSAPAAWLEMNATRYTKWANIGDKQYAGLMLQDKGPYFSEY